MSRRDFLSLAQRHNIGYGSTRLQARRSRPGSRRGTAGGRLERPDERGKRGKTGKRQYGQDVPASPYPPSSLVQAERPKPEFLPEQRSPSSNSIRTTDASLACDKCADDLNPLGWVPNAGWNGGFFAAAVNVSFAVDEIEVPKDRPPGKIGDEIPSTYMQARNAHITPLPRR